MRSVKVTEYMARNLTTFTPETKVFEALEVLLRKNYSGAPVVNASGELVGVLSEADLMRVAIQGSYHGDTSGLVGDFMSTKVTSIAPDLDLYSVAEMFAKHHYKRFPVVSAGKLVGMISRRDVLQGVEDFVAGRRR